MMSATNRESLLGTRLQCMRRAATGACTAHDLQAIKDEGIVLRTTVMAVLLR